MADAGLASAGQFGFKTAESENHMARPLLTSRAKSRVSAESGNESVRAATTGQ